MSDKSLPACDSASNSGKKWIDDIQFEVLGNLRTDFTLMTYTNQPSRNTRKSKGAATADRRGPDDSSTH
jgi:hypothetical protein